MGNTARGQHRAGSGTGLHGGSVQAIARVAKGGGVRDANKHNNCPMDLATGPQRIRPNAIIRPDAGCRMPDAGCRMAPRLSTSEYGHESLSMAAWVPSSVLPA